MSTYDYDSFEGPTDEERTAALKRHRALRDGRGVPTTSSGQGSCARIIGTPRKGKHKGGTVDGVRMK